MEPYTIVEDPGAWYADQYRNKDSWITQLTEKHVEELDAAVGAIQQKGNIPIEVRGMVPHGRSKRQFAAIDLTLSNR